MRATSRSRTTEPLAGSARTTMSPNCCGSLSRPSALTCISKGVPGGRRRLADLAGGDLDVLLGDGVLHVDRGDAEIGELVGIEPDAHRIAPLAEDLDVADAGQPLQRIDDLQIGVVADSATGSTDPSGEVRLTIRTKFGFCFLIVTPPWLTIAGQRGRRLRDAVLHVDGGDVERIADIEGDGDRRGAVVGARRRHVGHALRRR